MSTFEAISETHQRCRLCGLVVEAPPGRGIRHDCPAETPLDKFVDRLARAWVELQPAGAGRQAAACEPARIERAIERVRVCHACPAKRPRPGPGSTSELWPRWCADLGTSCEQKRLWISNMLADEPTWPDACPQTQTTTEPQASD